MSHELDRRVSQVVLLLESLDDLRPAPETWTGQLVRRGAVRGPSPTSWKTCEGCAGEGKTRDRFGRDQVCEACKGRGRLKVDDYTTERVVDEHAGLSLRELIRRDTVTVPCNVCMDLLNQPTGVVHGERCWRCDGTGRAPVPGSWLSAPESAHAPSGDPLADQIARRDQAGSYHELEHALTDLYAKAPKVARMVSCVHVWQNIDPAGLQEDEQVAVRLGLVWLAWRMPDQIRVPRQVIQAAARCEAEAQSREVRGAHDTSPQFRKQRNKDIRRHHGQGRSVQWLAREFGLSVRTIYEVVNGREALA